MLQSTRQVHSASTSRSENALKKTNRELKKILERLSTGKRVNRASDDASAMAMSEIFQSRIRGFKMASNNIDDALSALDIMDSTGRSVTNLLQRQRELALSARQDTLSSADRKSIDTEYQALTQEIIRTTSAAQFNRQSLTDGTDLSSGSAQIQSGTDAGDTHTLPAINLLLPAQSLQETSLLSSEQAQTALSALDSVIGEVSAQIGTTGATYNRLISTRNSLEVAMINTVAAESIIADQDMAEGVAKLLQTRLIEEGAVKAFSHFQDISRNQILGLLQP